MSDEPNDLNEYKGLPVKGYSPTQSAANVELVNEGKVLEERVLRYIEKVQNHITKSVSPNPDADKPFGKVFPPLIGDPRFLAIGKTEIQMGFMAIYRSVFNPQRIPLPEDDPYGRGKIEPATDF